jgi:ferredoxin-type protein NapF
MTEVAVSRRQFLRGDVRGSRAGIRPPWALPEAAFTAQCTRCDDCVTACPDSLIARGSGGYPEIDFRRGACTFCRKCVDACRASAFQAGPVGGHLPWAHRAVIGAGCLAANGVVCRACGDHCETGAIRFRLAPGGRSFAQVELARCTGCGGCVGICPVGAVVMQVPAPAEAAA